MFIVVDRHGHMATVHENDPFHCQFNGMAIVEKNWVNQIVATGLFSSHALMSIAPALMLPSQI